MTATLTPEQVRTIASAKGETVLFTDPTSNQAYVLIKAEVFEGLQHALGSDSVGPVKNLVSGTRIGYNPQPSFLTEIHAWTQL